MMNYCGDAKTCVENFTANVHKGKLSNSFVKELLAENPEELKNHNGIIANPNCSTIQAVLPLKVLDDDTTIYDIYTYGKSKDLKITFNEVHGLVCTHMNFLK